MERTVEADALRILGLARRAGHAVVGSEAVLLASRKGALAAIVLARDVGPAGLRRVRSALRATPAFECGTKRELGAAVGRGHVAVVGVTDPGLARRATVGMKEHRPVATTRVRA